MVRNQLHGKTFEDQIKGCGRFPGSSDHSRALDAAFDIEAKFDRDLHLPTSIKAMGGATVALSDARRFWRIEKPFRMMVGKYTQLADRKSFESIHEFLIGTEMLQELRGEISLAQVAELHEGIGLARFPAGAHASARAWAAKKLADIAPLRGHVRLNRKIDSQGQRRFQCSVPLAALKELAERHPEFVAANGRQAPSYTLHSDRIGALYLPIVVHGSAREFNAKVL